MRKAQKSQRVLVTGSSGFLGQHVVSELMAKGCEVIPIRRLGGFDLLQENHALTALLTTKPDIVIHLASSCPDKTQEGSSFRDTIRMDMNVLDASVLASAKFVTVSPRSAYADPSLFGSSLDGKNLPESMLHFGIAQDGVGDAKRAIAAACSRYHKQYGLDYAFLVLSSLYGPFDPGKVGIGFMIDSIISCSELPEFGFAQHMAKEEKIECLFVQDAAQAIVTAALLKGSTPVVNIGAQEALTREEVSEMVSDLIGYEGEVLFDKAKAPPFIPLSSEMAEKRIGWKSETSAEEGIKKTTDWFVSKGSPEEVKA